MPDNEQTKTSKHGLTRNDIIKFSVLVAFVAAGIIATIAMWPFIMSLTTEDGIAQITQVVRDSGPLAVLVLLGLQLLQVIIAFIPGEVVQIVAGMLYGPLWGSVLILFGACVSTIIIYYLVQKLGTPFVTKLVKKETQEKLDFITRTSRIDAIVLVLFLIPGLPKDVITYIIALTDVRPSRFFIFSTVGRIPGVVISSYAGDAMVAGNWQLLIIIIVVVVVILIVAFLLRDKIMGRFNSFADDNSKEDSKETAAADPEEIAESTASAKDHE